ncbi:MAG: hypothetical protein P1U56_01500, partial [Saprospiraceae bacterium]|nr:hypothetical protein [Saprospiraceae bacterium]
EGSSAPQKTNTDASFKRVVSDGEYNFQLEYNHRLDTSYLDVVFQGRKKMRYGYGGKVDKEFLIDMNRDQKNELYVVVERSHNKQLFGYYFENGESKEIKREMYGESSNKKVISYKVERNQIVEQYNNTFANGQIEKTESRYNLVKDGLDYILLPQGWLPNELKNMAGQYAARDAAGAGYYKVMLLTQLRGGTWNVDIKVKRNGDKKEMCSFVGNGYFKDQFLFVPMKDVNPDLKGTLKIRFLDLLSIVYTENPADSKEMVAFCDGVGSIAGNFKKTNL